MTAAPASLATPPQSSPGVARQSPNPPDQNAALKGGPLLVRCDCEHNGWNGLPPEQRSGDATMLPVIKKMGAVQAKDEHRRESLVPQLAVRPRRNDTSRRSHRGPILTLPDQFDCIPYCGLAPHPTRSLRRRAARPIQVTKRGSPLGAGACSIELGWNGNKGALSRYFPIFHVRYHIWKRSAGAPRRPMKSARGGWAKI